MMFREQERFEDAAVELGLAGAEDAEALVELAILLVRGSRGP